MPPTQDWPNSWYHQITTQIDSSEVAFEITSNHAKLSQYANGDKCGSVGEVTVIRVMPQPLRLDDGYIAVDYVLYIASTKPMIVYLSDPSFRVGSRTVTEPELNALQHEFDAAKITQRIEGFVLDFSRTV